MIAFLKGILKRKAHDHVILLSGEVGYKIHLAARNLEVLGDEGEALEMEIETVVSENDIVLYGFVDPYEAKFFSYLIGITGIGPKTALNILNQSPWENLFVAAKEEDFTKLRTLKGVGEKTARLMLIGLKNKLAEFENEWVLRHAKIDFPHKSKSSYLPQEGMLRDAENALLNLGYARHDIRRTLANSEFKALPDLQAVIKRSLLILSGQVPLE